MPDDEEIDEFVSLWKKKKPTDAKPSIVQPSVERDDYTDTILQEYQNENAELKRKMKENIEVISRTEQIIERTMRDKQLLESEVENLKEQNLDLNTKVVNLEDNLREKDTYLLSLKAKVEASAKGSDSPKESAILQSLQSELTQKKAQVSELSEKISSLESRIKENSSQTADITKDIKTISPESEQSSKTLEILVQDLQSELNKYKKAVKKLKDENSHLKSVAGGGISNVSAELEALTEENRALKKEISELEKLQGEISKKTLAGEDSKIKELQNQLKEKDVLIAELKSGQTGGSGSAPKGLVEDLQRQINRLKAALKKEKEKNK